MEIRDALTFDDILGTADPPSSLRSRNTHTTDALNRAWYPADLCGDGHGHGIEHGNCDGQAGGIGVLHKNMDMANRPTKWAVKKFESGWWSTRSRSRRRRL